MSVPKKKETPIQLIRCFRYDPVKPCRGGKPERLFRLDSRPVNQ
jgi:hypothetical protein